MCTFGKVYLKEKIGIIIKSYLEDAIWYFY